MGSSADIDKLAENFDHHSPEYGEHLYDIYRHMRSNCPFAHSEAHDGFWVATEYDTISEIARDDETFSSKLGITIPDGKLTKEPRELPYSLPIEIDPPESRAYRKVLDSLFSPKALGSWEPEVKERTQKLVDAFIENGRGDLVRDLAQPLTAMITLRMTGIDPALWREFSDPVHNMIWNIGEREQQAQDMWRLDEMLESEVVRQRANPIDSGVISFLNDKEIDGRRLEDWEITSVARLFILGGVDTTQAFMGSVFVELGRRPDLRQQFIERLGTHEMTSAIEEMLRYVAPQQALARTVTRDTSIAGKALKKGDRVLLCWASANRDPKHFENPEEINLERKVNRHMTFGVGMHRCMGSHLARIESNVMLTEILTRLPDYQLDESGLQFAPDVGVVYGYSAVPVTFTPGQRVVNQD